MHANSCRLQENTPKTVHKIQPTQQESTSGIKGSVASVTRNGRPRACSSHQLSFVIHSFLIPLVRTFIEGTSHTPYATQLEPKTTGKKTLMHAMSHALESLCSQLNIMYDRDVGLTSMISISIRKKSYMLYHLCHCCPPFQCLSICTNTTHTLIHRIHSIRFDYVVCIVPKC